MHNQMVFKTEADLIRKKNWAGPEAMENLLTGKSVNILKVEGQYIYALVMQ
jgi:hypothetical protein